MQKRANLVDLVKSFPTNIFLQNLASIQKRTSPKKFAQLAEKSEKGSISNLSTKVRTPEEPEESPPPKPLSKVPSLPAIPTSASDSTLIEIPYLGVKPKSANPIREPIRR